MAIHRSEIEFDTNGRQVKAYLSQPPDGGPGILVLPSWWGLKTYFREVCDRLAEHGYTALAPDYYDGQVGETIEETQVLQQAAESDMDAMGALIQGAKDTLVAMRPSQPIGILGFSMGTDWAVITAAKAADVAATVLFYGGYTPDFSQMKSKVLVHYAESDEWFSLEAAQEMVEQMRSAGVDVTLHIYPGVAHWFMEDDRPEFNAVAAQLAWERTFEFLEHTLKTV